jgi:hypothetical protein
MGGSRRSLFGAGEAGACERLQSRPPPQQRDQRAISHTGGLGQSLVGFWVMQTELAIHRAANSRLPPLRMLDQGATLDPLGERATVGLSLPTFLRLETMQLPVMPDERSHAHQPFVIGRSCSPDRGSGQHPGVYAMGFPDLCQLFARNKCNKKCYKCYKCYKRALVSVVECEVNGDDGYKQKDQHQRCNPSSEA